MFVVTLTWLHVSDYRNFLAPNNCLSHRNVFQNGVNILSKTVNHFCQNAKNFVWFGLHDFVQILPARGPNTYHITYGETLDFQCQHQQW